jgi:hypothetical protein
MTTDDPGVQPSGGPFHAMAWAAVLAGGAGSIGLMYRAGSRAPWLLLAMFVLWVVSPFVALAWALLAAPRWPAPARAAARWTTVVVAAASLALYARLIPAPRSPNAFIFIVGPVAAWLAIAIAGLIAWRATAPSRSATPRA